MYIKSTYDGLHVITGTTENVSACPLSVRAIGCLNQLDRDPRFSFECAPAVLLSVVRVWVPCCLFLLLVHAAYHQLLSIYYLNCPLLLLFMYLAQFLPPPPCVKYSFCTLEVFMHEYKNNVLFAVENHSTELVSIWVKYGVFFWFNGIYVSSKQLFWDVCITDSFYRVVSILMKGQYAN